MFIFIIIFFLFTLISYITPINLYISKNIDNIISINDILFSAIGVIFSIGFSILLSLDLFSIKNERSFKSVTKKLENIKNYTLCIFILSLIVYVISKIIPPNLFVIGKIYILPILSISFFIYTIISLSFTFGELYNQKVKIVEILLKEEKEELESKLNNDKSSINDMKNNKD
ncbi:hypothetical protein [Brachyspira hyodysenteriae]|uniref:hypothetical protein n=1 Tax=Brachyspira hyodysenteriae TaxID=159 RepID=UPI00063DCCA1|nr:hypothetical protein [Brachyspira hyodysenteriae]KLI15205.1 hypothetical protein SU46_10030 [Brachyspira hyodysenteriae]KLI33101.1 hypothetical protein SZ49_00250 [Brachyspira hyodysenteriae]